MADLLQDLEEEAQRERWRQFMRRYGLFFIAGALLALALTLAWLFWQQQRANAMEARSEAFLAALDSLAQGDTERASRQFAGLGEGVNHQRSVERHKDLGAGQIERRRVNRVSQYDTVKPDNILSHIGDAVLSAKLFFGVFNFA